MEVTTGDHEQTHRSCSTTIITSMFDKDMKNPNNWVLTCWLCLFYSLFICLFEFFKFLKQETLLQYNIITKFPVALTKIRGKRVSESSQSLFTFLRQIYGFLAESAQIICISADYILTNGSRICAILNHRQNKSHWGSRVSDTTLSIEWGCGVDFSSCGLAGFVSCFIHIPWQ